MCRCAAREELSFTENHDEKADNTYVVIHLKLVVYFRLSVSTSSSGTAVAQWLRCALQIGRSLVRFQVVSLEFFIDIIFLIGIWPWGRLSL